MSAATASVRPDTSSRDVSRAHAWTTGVPTVLSSATTAPVAPTRASRRSRKPSGQISEENAIVPATRT